MSTELGSKTESNILYPTYSDDLYTAAPESSGKLASLNINRLFTWGMFRLLLIVAGAIWFGYQARQEVSTLESISHYEVEVVVGPPSQDDVRELLLPSLQETVDAVVVFEEFQQQVKTLLDLRINDESYDLDISQAIDKDSKAVSFEEALKSKNNYRDSTASINDPSLVLYYLKANSISAANEWLGQLLVEAERETARILVERAQGLLDKEIALIEDQFADDKLIGQRELSKELGRLKKDLELAKSFGIVNPVPSAHPRATDEDGVRYLEGATALEKKYKKLAARLDDNTSIYQSGDERLLAELEVLNSIRLDPQSVTTADLRPRYRSHKVLNELSVQGPTLLGGLKGALYVWIALLVLMFIISWVRNRQSSKSEKV